MKMLMATQPALFNEKQFLFETENKMPFFEKLNKIEKELVGLCSQQEEDRRLLDQLEPSSHTCQNYPKTSTCKTCLWQEDEDRYSHY